MSLICLQSEIVEGGVRRVFCTSPFASEHEKKFIELRKQEWEEKGWFRSGNDPMKMVRGEDEIEFSVFPVVNVGDMKGLGEEEGHEGE